MLWRSSQVRHGANRVRTSDLPSLLVVVEEAEHVVFLEAFAAFEEIEFDGKARVLGKLLEVEIDVNRGFDGDNDAIARHRLITPLFDSGQRSVSQHRMP